MLSDEWKKYLGLAAACTGGVAVLLFPGSVVTLGLGIALGYKGRDQIRSIIEGGGEK